jgi:hypothetical protein
MKIKVYVIDLKLPRWLRRTLVFVGVPAVVLGLGALVHAALPAPVATFADGTVLSAALSKHWSWCHDMGTRAARPRGFPESLAPDRG